MNNQNLSLPGLRLEPEQVNSFFLHHLNRIYCAKAHLLERLPELAESAGLDDLRQAILETWDDIGKQMARVEQIYELLNTAPSITHCDELIDFMETGFNSVFEKQENPGLRDLSVLFYMSLAESAEMTSFKLLQLVAHQLPNTQVAKLLHQNVEASKAGRLLFLRITSKYIG